MFVAALSGYDQCLVEDKTAVCVDPTLVCDDTLTLCLLAESNAGSSAAL